jgi:selenobiotic family peptide radical SAM maturase
MATQTRLAKIFPVSRQIMGLRRWRRALAAYAPDERPERFPDALERLVAQGVPPYVSDLARLEWTRCRVGEQDVPASPDEGPAILNRTLELVPCRWHNLPQLLEHRSDGRGAVTEGEELVAVWRDLDGQTHLETARPSDLAALKVVVSETTPQAVAAQTGSPVGPLVAALRQAAQRGLILAPSSRLCRDPARFGPGVEVAEQFHAAQVFSLQWHLTQACDLYCRHCYDRTPRATPSLAEGIDMLQQLEAFCRSRQVFGQVSFTGGNPFLHPHFFELYRTAADLGFGCVVLGNPVPENKLEQLVAISPPLFYQVSLEGLEEHNDEIRGQGNFQKVLSFLERLRQFKIPSVVMLTLTRANLGQVIPLADILRHLAGNFTFNRLARFGEGARLELPAADEYRAFLAEYLEAGPQNPILGLKDSLFNILLEERGLESFGGCTGFGCGAAFNFVALLSDGEVHACRKFPSLIGNLKTASLEEVYDSAAAAQYRRGSAACVGCPLQAACGGCLAVTASLGGDPFTSRDPFCFRSDG